METLKIKQTSSTRAIIMARVLTSNKCYNVIKEKEMKKKAEEEEKQRRKREWEEKKEKHARSLAEEKASKIAEKARITETERNKKNAQKQHSMITNTESPKAVPKLTSCLGNQQQQKGKRGAFWWNQSWLWHQNTALCVLQWLMNGYNAPVDVDCTKTVL